MKRERLMDVNRRQRTALTPVRRSAGAAIRPEQQTSVLSGLLLKTDPERSMNFYSQSRRLRLAAG